jgi:molybdopterin-guanine dinucleotide biosynthesis protein B
VAGAGSVIPAESISFPVPLLGFCAYGSGIGKTTLLTSLIPILSARGLRISVIKHAHHTFDIDHPGKDSYRLRESGAVQMLLGSRHRWALMTELSRVPDRDSPEPSLSQLLQHIEPTFADLVVVEGFKQEPIPKIEVYRPNLNKPMLAMHDPHIVAIAADAHVATDLPLLNLNDPNAIADFIMQWLKQQRANLKLVSSR